MTIICKECNIQLYSGIRQMANDNHVIFCYLNHAYVFVSMFVYVVEDLDPTEEQVVYGTENNSTFLECVPRSPQATVTWHIQRDDYLEEVRHTMHVCCLQ